VEPQPCRHAAMPLTAIQADTWQGTHSTATHTRGQVDRYLPITTHRLLLLACSVR